MKATVSGPRMEAMSPSGAERRRWKYAGCDKGMHQISSSMDDDINAGLTMYTGDAQNQGQTILRFFKRNRRLKLWITCLMIHPWPKGS